MNTQKLKGLVKTPRTVNDDRYDSLSLDYTKYSQTMTFVQLGAAIVAIIFGILAILNFMSYTLCILGLLVFAVGFAYNKFVLRKQDIALNRKAVVHAEASVIAVVQASDYYGVLVFAKNDTELQANTQSLLETAEKLRGIGDLEPASDPELQHIQQRLWDTKDYFSAEPINESITGLKDIWWKVESVSSITPPKFDQQKDCLVGFIKEEDGETYLDMVEKDFYAKYLN